MKRIVHLTTIFLSLSLLTSCIDSGKVKEKIQLAKEKIAEKKAEVKAKAGEPSRTSAQEKALDTENPWYTRDFRMELTVELAGGVSNAIIQKSGDVLYNKFWNKSGGGEKVFIIGDDDIKAYLINSSTKMAQLQKTYTKSYAEVFRDNFVQSLGIIYLPSAKKKEMNQTFVKTETEESVEVVDEKWNGFDCEKITRVSVTKSDASAGLKAIGALIGKKELGSFVKDSGLGDTKTTDIYWLHKETGAVLHREYKMDSQNQGLSQFVTQMGAMPTVSVFTLNPDPSLIPTSLEGYKLVE